MNETVEAYHPVTGGRTVFPRSSFEKIWRNKGWLEVGTELPEDIEPVEIQETDQFKEDD